MTVILKGNEILPADFFSKGSLTAWYKNLVNFCRDPEGALQIAFDNSLAVCLECCEESGLLWPVVSTLLNYSFGRQYFLCNTYLLISSPVRSQKKLSQPMSTP
jgi:hypothetical protein